MNRAVFENIIPIFERNDVKFAGVFGSAARVEAKDESDVDILVSLKKQKSLVAIVGLEMELSEVLKKKVDLVTYRSVHPLLKESILNNQFPLL